LALFLASCAAGLLTTPAPGESIRAATGISTVARYPTRSDGVVLGAPSPPQNLLTEAGDGQVTLTWNPPSEDGGLPILYYNIYRGTTSGGEEFLILWVLTTYLDLDVANGVTYYYQVTAVNLDGESGRSNEASATPGGAPTVPGPPRSLAAIAGDATVTLSWLAPTDDGGSPVTNYNVYRGETPGSESFYDVVGDVLSYTDTGVTNGVTYYYQVSAVNNAGEGPLSNEASATPYAPPGTPEDLAATGGDGKVTLTWSAPPDDGGSPITNYNVYRGIVSGGELILETVGNVLAYTDTLVINGVTYYYQVSARNDAGEGPRSNEASATPEAGDTVPGAPQDLVATGGDGTVALEWAAPVDDGGSPITNYRIYRGTTPGSASLHATVGNVDSYSDEGLTNGETYYYRVAAVNRVGEGGLSSEAAATPTSGPNVPNPPRSLTATPGDGSITLNWLPPIADGGAPVLNYTVYRGFAPDRLSVLARGGTAHSLWDGGLTNGETYYYAISAVNAVGEGPRTEPVAMTPNGPGSDTTMPTIVIASPTSGATVSRGTITVSGTASDNVGVVRIEVSADGTTWSDASGIDTWTGTLSVLEGDRTIHARATDAAGNVGTATVSVTVSGSGEPREAGPAAATGADQGWAMILMASFSFALAAGIAWIVLNRHRKSGETDSLGESEDRGPLDD
jgi:titin